MKVGRKAVALVTGLVAALTIAGGALALVTFDSDTGEGFVGKGDVQLVFGWNNKQLQENAPQVQFRYAAGETVEWTCVDPDPANPPFPASQKRTSTQSIAGAPDADPRQKKGQQQFTGFNLLGYIGDPVIVSEGGHTYPECTTNRTHDPSLDKVTSLGGGLQVSINETDWFDIS